MIGDGALTYALGMVLSMFWLLLFLWYFGVYFWVFYEKLINF